MNNFALLKTTRRARLLILFVSIALLASACNKAANTNNANSANSSSTNTNSTSSTSTPTTSTSPALSPTATYKAYQEAMKKKDFEGVKKRMSKGSLAMITEKAKEDGKTLEESFKEEAAKGGNDEEVTNEKITGDTATIDVKGKDASLTIPLVKEDGEWKIAFDVFVKQLEEAFKEMGNEMNKKSSKSDDTHGGGHSDNENK